MSVLVGGVIIAGADAFVPALSHWPQAGPLTHHRAAGPMLRNPKAGVMWLAGRSKEPGANAVVSKLLEIVSPGLEGEYSSEQRQTIDTLLARLDETGTGRNFLQDDTINDYYRVQFTRDVGRGKPVGGGFRYSALGRALFKVPPLTSI